MVTSVLARLKLKNVISKVDLAILRKNGSYATEDKSKRNPTVK